MTDNLSDNELIAEFMGMPHEKDPFVKSNKKYWHYKELGVMSESLQFDTSWDWLMPVVEKIRYANIEGSRRNELIDKINYALSCVDIGEVYKNAVKFIVHFNSKTKPV